MLSREERVSVFSGSLTFWGAKKVCVSGGRKFVALCYIVYSLNNMRAVVLGCLPRIVLQNTYCIAIDFDMFCPCEMHVCIARVHLLLTNVHISTFLKHCEL